MQNDTGSAMPNKPKRGFAAMSEEQKKQIAAKGGKAAHAKGKAYRFSSDTAKAAGKKGGQTVSKNKDHMAAIGQKGGLARSGKLGKNRYEALIEHGKKMLESLNSQTER